MYNYPLIAKIMLGLCAIGLALFRGPFFLANSVNPISIDPDDLGARVVMTTLGPLTQDAKEDFADFRRAEYYGAFADNPVEGSFGYYHGVISIDFARDLAIKMCRARSDDATHCRIYAELHPEKAEIMLPVARMSANVDLAFVEDYLRYERYGDYGAFAVNKFGTYGYSKNYGSKKSARIRAQEICREGATTHHESSDTFMRNTISRRDWACSIVHQWHE